jgi:hypothetical protein
VKKKVAIALLAVVLLLAGLGGVVYAATDESVHGDKLVGLAPLGSITQPDGIIRQYGVFYFTNPDCVNKITITQVSIMRMNGSIVYQGPFINAQPGQPREVITRPMEPHEVWSIFLFNYMYKGTGELTDPNSWLTSEEAQTQTAQSYTVEIFWRPSKKVTTCPLTGWQDSMVTKLDSSGNLIWTRGSESQMVNMTQGK